MIRLNFKRPVELLFCRIKPSHMPVNETEVIVILGFCLLVNGALEIIQGLLEMPRLQRQHSEEIQGIGLLRLDVEHCLVSLFGFNQSAALVEVESLGKNFLDRHRLYRLAACSCPKIC